MLKQVFTLICVSLALVACNGSNSGNKQGPEIQASLEIPDSPKIENYLSLVELVNPGAEKNTGIDKQIISKADKYGWDSNGQCEYRNDYAAPGEGQWRIDLAPGCSVFQTSAHQIEKDQSFSLIFDASLPGMTTGSITAEIFVTGSKGQEQHTVASQTFHSNDSVSNGWNAYQMIVDYKELDSRAGEYLGLRFTNKTDSGSNLAIDNIQLEAHNSSAPAEARFNDSWSASCDQRWAGENYWANRLHDWQIKDGKLQTVNPRASQLRRTVHRISSVVNSRPEDFELNVKTGSLNSSTTNQSYNGFLIGAGFRLDYRAASLIHNRHGKNGGIIAGVDQNGHAFIRDNGASNTILARAEDSNNSITEQLQLKLLVQFQQDQKYKLTLQVQDNNGTLLNQAEALVPVWRVMGNIALVSNPGVEPLTRHWFNDFSGSGKKLINARDREFGPIMFTSYTLSRQILTVNAQFPPSCNGKYQNVRLEVEQDKLWVKLADAEIDDSSYTSQLRVYPWSDTDKRKYRIAADEIVNGTTKSHYYYGYIQADPKYKENIRLAGLTCRPGVILSSEGWIQQNSYQAFSWTEKRLAFPHKELLINAHMQQADLNFFTGDQLYEFDPNGFVDKTGTQNLINDYLYKWYLFGWSVKDFMRNTPTVIIPDDHDVYQSNLWGEGGRNAQSEQAGGYVNPAEFIRIVEKTQTGSLPPAYDLNPIEQGISTYYTDLVYGEIGIAVLEDRKFKSGPHSPDRPLRLLGQRQHKFLDYWTEQWDGQQMKLAVSQAPFAMSHTHSSSGYQPSGLDHDSNGWPPEPRAEAVARLRTVFAPHVNGDQHLGLTLKHGIENPADAIYSFSVPSMLNVFPRVWDPQNSDKPGPGNRENEQTGSFTDKHGNYMDVIAVANPNEYYKTLDANNTSSKYDLGTGYGIIDINKSNRSYSFEAWPINADPSDPTATPYPGWPVIFNQNDNDGRTPSGYLHEVESSIINPLVMLIDESEQHLMYAKRLQTSSFSAPVYNDSGLYTLKFVDPETGIVELFQHLSVISE